MNFVARYDILCPNRHSAEHEFENKIHGYLHMEEEPDFSHWNFAFDPLLPLFRPYDPNFLIARRRTIDPELWAFLDEGIEPRQYVQQRPGTDDLAFRRGKLWVGVGFFFRRPCGTCSMGDPHRSKLRLDYSLEHPSHCTPRGDSNTVELPDTNQEARVP